MNSKKNQNKKYGIMEYVATAHQDFDEKAFNNIDSLVLSQLAYIKFEIPAKKLNKNLKDPHMSLKDFNKAEFFDEMFSDRISDKENIELFSKAVASKRFRNIKIKNIVSKMDRDIEKQFAAMTFELNPEISYAAFRGTDGSMLGWKEDFNMSFMEKVPSQEEAAGYINANFGSKGIFSKKRKIYIGGHSKGGNLAIFASAMSKPEIHKNIITVFSHDGPGFHKDTLDKILKIAEEDNIKLVKEIPETSIIGMLLETEEDYKVIESNATGIMQHLSFSLRIQDDEFVYLDKLSGEGRYVNRTVSNWLENAPKEKRKVFIDTIFRILEINNINHAGKLKSLSASDIKKIVASTKELDAEEKEISMEMIKSFMKISLKSIDGGGIIEKAKEAINKNKHTIEQLASPAGNYEKRK